MVATDKIQFLFYNFFPQCVFAVELCLCFLLPNTLLLIVNLILYYKYLINDYYWSIANSKYWLNPKPDTYNKL